MILIVYVIQIVLVLWKTDSNIHNSESNFSNYLYSKKKKYSGKLH